MAVQLTLSRKQNIPDLIKLARYEKAPEFGPRILFFSGGTALRELCRKLVRHTHNSIHVMTPFDFGGSSAKLRKVFHMPAIGDIRNRIMILAEDGMEDNRGIYELLTYRFPHDGDEDELRDELRRMAAGRHQLTADAPEPMSRIIKRLLRFFLTHMPGDFDLRGASIGNLALTAGYLENNRMLDPDIYIFSKLVNARGIVRPIINADMHLIAELENGEVLCGQHKLTGKEAPPITSKVSRVYLSKKLDDPEPIRPPIRSKMRELIASADLICYPMGSFYSSLIANLLPRGVGRAIADTPCPKIFIPNSYEDPESFGLTITEQIQRLVETLAADEPDAIAVNDALNFVLMDESDAGYGSLPDPDVMRRLGVELVRMKLRDDDDSLRLNADLLEQALTSMA